MQTQLHDSQIYDYRQYDHVWKRVCPQLEPYPAELPEAPPAVQNRMTVETPSDGELTVAQKTQLPGAVTNPCCMGDAAAQMLDVLTGYVEEELSDQRYYMAMLRCAPSWARQTLREIAADEGAHARRLMAVYYLITGNCYQSTVSCGRVHVEGWCAALRQRYHEEVCGGFNYGRSADETTDPCLSRLLEDFSEEEYHHGQLLLGLLERSLKGRGQNL